MNGELIEELQYKVKQLETSVKSLRKTGSEAAQAEHDYKVLLSQKCLELKAQGTPATMIALVAYGLQDVAKARLERDIATTIYQANQESINSLKLQIRIIDSQIQREWGTITHE